MATAAERQKKIDQIRELPAKLEQTVASLSEAQLDATAGKDEWSIRQLVHHLADAHLNAFLRTKLILTEDKPILKPFDQASWVRLPDTTDLPIRPSLEILRGIHYRWSGLLEGLPESAWGRVGIHLEAGIITMENLLDTYSKHGEDHLQQIERTKAG